MHTPRQAGNFVGVMHALATTKLRYGMVVQKRVTNHFVPQETAIGIMTTTLSVGSAPKTEAPYLIYNVAKMCN